MPFPDYPGLRRLYFTDEAGDFLAHVRLLCPADKLEYCHWDATGWDVRCCEQDCLWRISASRHAGTGVYSSVFIFDQIRQLSAAFVQRLTSRVGLHSIDDKSHLEHSHSLEQTRPQTPAEDACIATDSEAEPSLFFDDPAETVEPSAALVLRYSSRQQQTSDQSVARGRPHQPGSPARPAHRSLHSTSRRLDSSPVLRPGSVFQDLEELREAAEGLKEAHKTYDVDHAMSKEIFLKRSTSAWSLRAMLKSCCWPHIKH